MSQPSAEQAQATSAASSPVKPSAAAAVGAGLAFITLAKLYFIVTGFAVQVGLPRLLGSPEAFGQYSLAMSIANVVDNVLIAATVQSLSKRVSENEALGPARLRQGLKLQLVIGVVIASGLMLLAPSLAKLAYDPELTTMLQIAAFVPLCYAIYAALVGSLNGQRKFRSQATLDVTFSSVRTVGILGAAALGYGAIGALCGFAAAAVVILSVALLMVGTGAAGDKLPIRVWLQFLLPIALFQLMLNGMLLLDVWVLKNTTAQLGLELGHSLAEATAQASALVGYYRAAQNFALVPYQVILSVTFVVFPLVSRAVAENDVAAAKVHIQGALRFSVIVLFMLACPLSGSAEGLIRLAYGAKFLPGASTLSILVFGQLSLALFVIVATILSGAGRPGLSAGIGLFALLAMLAANRFLVRAVGIGDSTLAAAAIATSLGPLLALVLSTRALHRLFAVGLPLLTLLRCALAAAVGACAARFVPQHSGLLAPVAMLAGGLAYLTVLLATGEISQADRERVLGVLKKKRARVADAPAG
jgi:stage V sporulation protein B